MVNQELIVIAPLSINQHATLDWYALLHTYYYARLSFIYLAAGYLPIVALNPAKNHGNF